MSNNVSIHICETSADFEIVKSLTLSYFDWLGMDLNFQNTEKEFDNFDKMYGKPKGCFIYATINGAVAGGVGTRFLESGICEMKRLYVNEDSQGKGVGKLLCNEILRISKDLGYSKMRLDTVSRLEAANALYEGIGFYDIPKYYENPDPTVRYTSHGKAAAGISRRVL